MPYVSKKYKQVIKVDIYGQEYVDKELLPQPPVGLSYVPELPKIENRQSPSVVIPYLSINQGYSIAYALPIEKSWHSNVLGLNKRNKQIQEMSNKSTSKIYNAIKWLHTISEMKKVYSIKEKSYFKFKLCFITLTLSDTQKHTDQYIKKKMLEPFLKWLIYSYRCINFIWKAEVQDNGNIHFHITTNKFIHWRAIKKKWNRLQQRYGYTQKHGDENKQMNINSTDIHSVKNIKEVMHYFSKYISKSDTYKKTCYIGNVITDDIYHNENNTYTLRYDGAYYPLKRKIHGMVWNCSQSLKKTAIILDGQMDEYREMLPILSNKEIVTKKEMDYRVVYMHKKKIMNHLPVTIQQEIRERIKKARKADKTQLMIEIESFN